jgi:PQQ-like domain
MVTERIIELDLEPGSPSGPPPPGRAGALRLSGSALVVALCAATLGAAGRPPIPPFTHLGFVVPPTPASLAERPADMTLVGGMLLVRRDFELIAFAPTGERLWATHFDDGLTSLSYRMWQGNLLVMMDSLIHYAGEGYAGRATIETVALDPATGAQRWRVDGAVRQAGDVVVVDDGVHAKRVYRSLPSDLLWTVPPSLASTVDAKGGAIFAITEEGVLTEHELRTGAVRASAKVEVPHVTGSPGDGPRNELISIEVIGDLVLLRAERIIVFEEGLPQMRAYDRATLRPATNASNGFVLMVNCGPVVCAMRGEQLTILDPDDLSELWRAPPGQFPYWNGSMMIVGGQFAESFVRVLDPRTGRILITLDEWRPVEQWDLSPGRTWLTRPTASGVTSVGMLESTGLRVIGTLPMRLVDCQVDGLLLACTAPDARIEVWRVELG